MSACDDCRRRARDRSNAVAAVCRPPAHPPTRPLHPWRSITKHFNRVEAGFDQLVAEGALILSPAPDFAQPAVRAEVEAMTLAFEANPYVQPPIVSWLRVFALWQKSSAPQAVAAVAAAGATFHTQLEAFLRAPPFTLADGTTHAPSAFGPDVVRATAAAAAAAAAAGGGAVTHSRFKMRVLAPTSLTARIDVMNALRAVFDASAAAAAAGGRRLEGYPYAYFFMYSDRDVIVHHLIKVTLIGAAAAVVVVLLLFLRPATVFGIACCVAVIDASLFGLMAVWDVPIDVSSFICLVIAVGLSVDYVVHLGHAFEHTPAGATAGERVAAMLDDIGASVVKGGMSTFLGILVLAFTSSAVFRLFFKMLFGTVVFGLFAGLVLFPAIMSLSGGSAASGGDNGGRDQAAGAPKAPVPAAAVAEEAAVVEVQEVQATV